MVENYTGWLRINVRSKSLIPLTSHTDYCELRGIKLFDSAVIPNHPVYSMFYKLLILPCSIPSTVRSCSLLRHRGRLYALYSRNLQYWR